MKKSSLFLFLLLTSISWTQKAQFSFYIPLDFPNKTIMPNMNFNIGLGLSAAYRPVFGFPMLGEFKASLGSYATRSSSETVQFSNYTNTTTVHSTYSSKMNKYLLGTKWLVGYDIKTIRGFITPQIGLVNFKTNTNISYNDNNNKSQTSKQVSQRELTSVYGGEIGMEILLNNIFKKKMNGPTKHRVVFSYSFLRSFKNAEYTNMYNLKNYNTDQPDPNVQYINIKNNYSYDQNYTELYRTKLALWGLNIGYIINLGYDTEEDKPIQ